MIFSQWRAGAVVVAPTYIVNDTFTSASSVLLSAHSPDTGGAWTTSDSMTVGADTGVVSVTAPNGTGVGAVNATIPSSANYTVGIVGRLVTASGSSNRIQVMGRRTTNYLTYSVSLDYTGAVVLSGATQLGSTYTIPGFSLSTDYTLELVMSGTSISAKVNGATVIGPITDSTYTVIGNASFNLLGVTVSPIITQFYIQ